MSQANVEMLRSAYADADPLTTFAARIAPDAEFDFTSAYPDRPVLRGVDEIRRFRDAGPWGRSIRFEPERYFDIDDERVLVFVRVTAVGQASGTPVEVRNAHEFTIRDGLIMRFKVHQDRSEALSSVGLVENDDG
jgi:ketosteroid isomerase-like protein